MNNIVFSVAVDFFDDLMQTPFDRRYLHALFDYFRSWGITRIYWIYTFKRSDCFSACLPYVGLQQNVEQTYDQTGDFLQAAVETARTCGMEIYAVIKPFDLGFNLAFPYGTSEARRFGKLGSLNGMLYWATDGLVKLHQMRMARNMSDIPADLDNHVISRIRLTADSQAPTRISKDTLALSVGSDNGTYRPYAKPFDFTDKIENGKRIIILEGLDVRDKYVALYTPFQDDKGAFKNKLSALMEVYDRSGVKLPFTYGFPRIKNEAGDTVQQRPPLIKFVFNDYNSRVFPRLFESPRNDECIVDNSEGCIALAKGKEPYIEGALSPAYQEVQNLWLDHIQACLQAGVDGIDLRVANHNRSLAWHEYGFEKPVVERYKQLYDIDILSSPERYNRALHQSVMAGFYTDFCLAATRLIRAAKKRVQFHIGTYEFPENDYMGLVWEWEKWIMQCMPDEITLKGLWPGDNNIDRVLACAKPRKIPAYACPYLNDTCGNTEFEASFRKRLFASMENNQLNGFILYEAAGVVNELPKGVIQPRLPEILRVIKEASGRYIK